jgi:leader peptidase (prepilin peptidase)/N-methyltransferase
MIRTLGKTACRTRQYLGDALTWQPHQRQYALVVWCFIAGWIWLLIGLRGNPVWPQISLSAAYLCCVLTAVCAIDARYGIIPDSLVAALAAGGLIQIVAIGSSDSPQRLAQAGLFFLAAWLFRACYRLIRGYHGLGFGDVKFATAAVLWTGILATPRLLIMAVLSALASLVILKMAGRDLDRSQAISFGPHLAIAAWLNWIANTVPTGL